MSTVARTEEAFEDGPSLIHVMDSEADDYPILRKLLSGQHRFIIRAGGNRRLQGEDGRHRAGRVDADDDRADRNGGTNLGRSRQLPASVEDRRAAQGTPDGLCVREAATRKLSDARRARRIAARRGKTASQTPDATRGHARYCEARRPLETQRRTRLDGARWFIKLDLPRECSSARSVRSAITDLGISTSEPDSRDGRTTLPRRVGSLGWARSRRFASSCRSRLLAGYRGAGS